METPDRLPEVLPLDEPHRIEGPAPAVATQAVDRDDARMLQPTGDLHLQQESLPNLRVVGEPVVEFLQCYFPAYLQVERDAHSSDATIGVVAEHTIPRTIRRRCSLGPSDMRHVKPWATVV